MSKPNRSAEPCPICGAARNEALEDALDDMRRLTRELDVAMHGEELAAKQASLCDLIPLAKKLRANAAIGARASSKAGDDARDAARYRRLRENWIECGELQFRGRLAVIDKHVDAAIATAKGSSK